MIAQATAILKTKPATEWSEMCTVLFDRSLSILTKNRDKTENTPEAIVQTAEILAVLAKGASYFSLGINKNGCAFVSTAVNTVAWTHAASQGHLVEAKLIADDDNRDLKSPTDFISRSFHCYESVKAIEESIAVESANTRWVGYNLVLVDRNEAFVLELHDQKMFKRTLDAKDVITNHFLELNHGPRTYQDYPSTFDRYKSCKERLPGSQTLGDYESILAIRDESECPDIWRKGKFFTVSSSILDLTDLSLSHRESPTQPYRRFRLTQE